MLPSRQVLTKLIGSLYDAAAEPTRGGRTRPDPAGQDVPPHPRSGARGAALGGVLRAGRYGRSHRRGCGWSHGRASDFGRRRRPGPRRRILTITPDCRCLLGDPGSPVRSSRSVTAGILFATFCIGSCIRHGPTPLLVVFGQRRRGVRELSGRNAPTLSCSVTPAASARRRIGRSLCAMTMSWRRASRSAPTIGRGHSGARPRAAR